MGIYLIYFLVIVLSNTIGAISGMGGGVIIKPVLDGIGYHSLAAISFYSSVAVLTMSVSSTFKQVKNGVKIVWPSAIAASIGAVIGGGIGQRLFDYLLTVLQGEKQVQLIQISLLIGTLFLVLLYTFFSKKTLNLKGEFIYLLVGIVLGSLSTLLGIGGGPINVSLLVFCFGLTMKDATVYSIITIFFSQIAKLGLMSMTTGFNSFDIKMLYVIVPAALLGGYLGGYFSGKVSDKRVSNIFVTVVVLVIGINLYNAWHLLV
ncbi:sulfite exporter TauE/SafE family protein [Vagococcus humatus]|uniref:Probable membrane transporter protein n=1 Tax=Vagococcus humatus TaxID=1889241 RepID=A0A429Z4W2_9ENTE|nr:sulfite exporter TauE/SafE family protein [Vagococcus humatus]RST88719.1 sulfite exporter TauE/SafE family protein [Vagococcus humatus]